MNSGFFLLKVKGIEHLVIFENMFLTFIIYLHTILKFHRE